MEQTAGTRTQLLKMKKIVYEKKGGGVIRFVGKVHIRFVGKVHTTII